ncbi:hypothetical protein BGZ94_008021 [Podila epigama]|nr:hypothetical protein BGZ94_008021 [Podila epigama]
MTLAKKNVIIIGAGISGLAAAQDLAKDASVKVTILEARNRLGGRIDTRRNLPFPRCSPGDKGHVALTYPRQAHSAGGNRINRINNSSNTNSIPIDFGASWIHGVDQTNPIMPLAEAAHVRLVPTNHDVVYNEPRQPALDEDKSNHYWAVLWDIFAQAKDFARHNKTRISVHTSFKTWFDQFLASRQSEHAHLPNYMSEDDLRVMPLLALFWADENAIELEKVSLKYMDAELMFPGDHSIVADGYDRLLDVMVKDIANVPIYLEHVVHKIEYHASGVTVSTNKGDFKADVVLVTLPLGVLKANIVTFSPPLPAKKQQVIQRLGFGTMVKIVLHFPTCFWPKDRHFINFLPASKSGQHVNSELTRHLNKKQLDALTLYMDDLANYTSMMPIHGAPILIGYATNAGAAAFEKLTEEEAMQVLFCQLSHYFPLLALNPDRYLPTHFFMTRWCADPFARGSYTSIPVGSHQSDLAEFEIPVAARAVKVELKSPTHEDEHIEDLCRNVENLDVKTAPITNLFHRHQHQQQHQHHQQQQGKTHKWAWTHNLWEQIASRDERTLVELNNAMYSRDLSKDNNHGTLIIPGALLPEQRFAQEHSQGYIRRHQHHQLISRGQHELQLQLQQLPRSQVGLIKHLQIPASITVKGLQNSNGFFLNLISGVVTLEKKPAKKDVLVCINGKNIVKSEPLPLLRQQTSHQQRQQLQQQLRSSGHTIASLRSGSLDPATTTTNNNMTLRAQDEHLENKLYKGENDEHTNHHLGTVIEMVAYDDIVQGRVFFAGEHTTPSSFASVHGALMTGRREAAKIMAQTFRT